jgi:hypothetical protein
MMITPMKKGNVTRVRDATEDDKSSLVHQWQRNGKGFKVVSM